MAKPAKIVGTYRLAMKRDGSRESMQDGALWNMVDLLPEVMESRARKRGPYTYASLALTATEDAYAEAGIVAPFTDGNSNLAFLNSGVALEIESSAATEVIGAANNTRSPVFYNNMVIVPDFDGTVVPSKITRSAGVHSISALSGSPPAGRYALVFKDVVWLASPSASADRIFFSVAGNPESWDTSQRWLDASFPITGMAALQNAVFVYGLSRTMRVRGSVPPPDTDFIVDDPIFDVGCTDSRSITNYRDKVVWANANGLYLSDGSALEDLTRICGMKSWWLAVMNGDDGFAVGETYYTPSGWSIVTEVYGDYLFYSINQGVTIRDAGVIDMIRYSWMRLSNIDMVSAWPGLYPEELYWGNRGTPRVSLMSTIFDPGSQTIGRQGASTNDAYRDADGTSILPVVETPFYMDNALLKTMRRAFVTYEARAISSGNDPSLTLSYVLSPGDSPSEGASYTAVSPTLPETAGVSRVHRSINRPSRGIAFKLEQTVASADTRLYDIELEAEEREGFR